jgi:hypothetical protein
MCKAGTMVLWNNSNVSDSSTALFAAPGFLSVSASLTITSCYVQIHAGIVRQTLRTRRTLGMQWYSELPAMLAATGSTTSNETREIRRRGIGRFVEEHP